MIRFAGGAPGRDGRPPPTVMMVCVALAAVSGLAGLWFIFGRDEVRAAPTSPSEGEKLLARSEARSAEMRASAAKLEQKPIGEGYELDVDGRVLGARADDGDLPQNRMWSDSAAPPSEPASAIRRRVAHRRLAGEGLDPERGSESGGRGQPYQTADRGLLTQSMLAYSRAQAGTGIRQADSLSSGGQSERSTRELQEERSEQRALDLMEKMQQGVLAQPSPESDGQGPAGTTLYPAATSAQAFGRGSIGDMRIGGGLAAVVRQGKFLDCALVNELRVDLAESPVVAMVTRNFLSADGSHVLIPQGAKLLGTAGTVQSAQQARVYIKFDRLIFPDQRSAYFPVRQVGAVDGAGAIGIPGEVDRHFLLQFGAAIMLGVLDGLGAAVQSANAVREPTARDLVLAQTSSNFAGILGGVLQRYANVVPTIRVPPGTTLKVFFAEDVRMSAYMRSSDLSWMQ